MLFKALHTTAFHLNRAPVGSPAQRDLSRDWTAIRDHIIKENIGLVYSMVGRFNSPQVDMDDLVSEAMFGLYRAVERYNPWKGYRFSTYACNCIARACMRQRKREQRRRDLIGAFSGRPSSLSTPAADDETDLRLERLKRLLDGNAAGLNRLEQRILHARFPSRDVAGRTFKEIGQTIGLSKERVRQIQTIALGKLRKALSDDPLLQ